VRRTDLIAVVAVTVAVTVADGIAAVAVSVLSLVVLLVATTSPNINSGVMLPTAA
jgi:hypothetical protein